MTRKSQNRIIDTQHQKEMDNGSGQTSSQGRSSQCGKIERVDGDGITTARGIELGAGQVIGDISGGGQDRAVKFVWCDNQKGMIPKCVCKRDAGKWLACKKCAYRKME